MAFLSEAQLETGLLEQLAGLGFACASDDLIGPDGKQPEREAYDEVVLQGRLSATVARLNPTLPREAQADAIRRLTQSELPNLLEENRRIHQLLTDGGENATLASAFNQLQTYKQQIPALFRSNAVLVTSDGLSAKVGSLSADQERFMPWRTIDGTHIEPKGSPEMATLIEGVFEPGRFLDLLRHFTVFGTPRDDNGGGGLIKIIAGYHLEVQRMEKKNLGLEALRKLLGDSIRSRTRTNVVETRAFTERLEDAIARYHANAITTAEVLQELINLAQDIRAARNRGEEQGLSDQEIAFYDALAENESAVQVMGDDKLRVIAHELLLSLRENVAVDWAHRESARARLRVLVKRILRKYGYPPDLQDAAVQTVLQQAEVLSASWQAAPSHA